MGTRRGTQEDQGRWIGELARQIPDGSEEHARVLYERIERAGRIIMGGYDPVVRRLRASLVAGVLLLAASMAGMGPIDVDGRWFLLGILLGIASLLFFLKTTLREFPQRLSAVMARNILAAAPVFRILGILIVIGQCAWMAYPMVMWVRSVLGIEPLTLTNLPFAYGTILGSLLGLLVAIPAALNLMGRTKATAETIQYEIETIGTIRQSLQKARF